MDTPDLESILTRRDLAAAEAAREHVGPHSVFLANYYWRTPDWVERSLVVHMVQDQRGPHLRSLFSDFLRAPTQAAEYADHVELTKAVCLTQLKGNTSLFAHYQRDRDALRRDIQAEISGPLGDPLGPQLGSTGPAAGSPPVRLGTPTPIAAPSPGGPPDITAPAALQPGNTPLPSASVPAAPSDLVWRARALVAVLAVALLWLLGLAVARLLVH